MSHSSSHQIDTLVIIGTGLIGGSLALALKSAGYCRRVIGCDQNIETLEQAVALQIIDHYSTDVTLACRGADMIVVCVPLGAMEAVFRAIPRTELEEAVITDVGSAKQSVIDAAQKAWGTIPPRFIPGHPIAGIEKSGVTAALDSLFQRRRVILTPLEQSDQKALKAVKKMWQAAGSTVHKMSPSHHDEILAGTSHLPHMLAFGLVNTLAHRDETRQIFEYAAGGFRDFTRIASSDPIMWRDICLANREAIHRMMTHYVNDMQGLADVIERADAEKLLELFTDAKATRDRFIRFLDEGEQFETPTHSETST
jgi:prephenate dehydrogenase